jgi:hypothetical protein
LALDGSSSVFVGGNWFRGFGSGEVRFPGTSKAWGAMCHGNVGYPYFREMPRKVSLLRNQVAACFAYSLCLFL